MKKLLTLALSIFAFGATAAKADDYIFVASNDGFKTVLFMNLTSLKSTKPNTYRAWFTYVFNGPDENSLGSLKGLQEVDCANETSQTLSTVTYGKDGNIVSSQEEATPVKRIVPESTASHAAKLMCDAKTLKVYAATQTLPADVDPITFATRLYKSTLTK